MESQLCFPCYLIYKGKKLLDSGCGTGGHLQLYLERDAASVVGTDLFPLKMLEQAEKDLQKCGQFFQVVFRYISYRWKNCQNCQNVILMSLPALFAFHYIEDFPALLASLPTNLSLMVH